MSCLKFSFSASNLLTLLPPKRELTPSAMAVVAFTAAFFIFCVLIFP
jgi:hypothetical protein